MARVAPRAEMMTPRVVDGTRGASVTRSTRAVDGTRAFGAVREALRCVDGARAWTRASGVGAKAPNVGAVTRSYAKKVAVGKGGKTRTKIKPYSSYAYRFKLSGSGTKILRKQKGKRHCAFSKTPKRRRMLRKTALVHASLVGPMKKLGFN